MSTKHLVPRKYIKQAMSTATARGYDPLNSVDAFASTFDRQERMRQGRRDTRSEASANAWLSYLSQDPMTRELPFLLQPQAE